MIQFSSHVFSYSMDICNGRSAQYFCLTEGKVDCFNCLWFRFCYSVLHIRIVVAVLGIFLDLRLLPVCGLTIRKPLAPRQTFWIDLIVISLCSMLEISIPI